MDYQKFVAWFNQNDLCSIRMGICLQTMGEGFAEATLSLTDDCRNIMGGMHGGALATLTDIVSGCAVAYHGKMCVTLDASIRYLKPVRNGQVHAIAREIHGGGRTAVVRVDVNDESGVLCCACTTTMYLTDQPISQLKMEENE